MSEFQAAYSAHMTRALIVDALRFGYAPGLIEAPESGEAGSINWPTCDAARAACDARMARDGVLFEAPRLEKGQL